MNENEKMMTAAWQFAKSLEGKIIHSNNAMSNLHFIDDAKKKAASYDWLYHCTNAIALKNILRSREFWLSNLQFVNDKNEAERIDSDEFKNTFFVSSFTYDPDIPESHWKEYGSEEDGVLVSVKSSWFERKATFLAGASPLNDDFFTIHKNGDTALRYKIDEQLQGRITNPFFIGSFGMYQVVYDDALFMEVYGDSQMEINGQVLPGKSVTPDVAGIVKNRKGPCLRQNKEPYEKNWEIEKEVRLKVRIQQLDNKKNGNELHDGMIMPVPFLRVAVPLNEEAFNEIRIRFSPKFQDKDGYLEEIRTLYPNCVVTEF